MNKIEMKKYLQEATDLFNNKQFDEAKTLYLYVIKHYPNIDPAYHMVGFIEAIQSNFQIAKKYVEKAISLYKFSTDYYNTLAGICRDLQLYPEAIKALQTALIVKKDDPETYNNLGMVLNDTGQLDIALKCFEIALQHDPNASFIHFNYALCLLKSGNYKKGWEEYEWRHKLTSSEPPPLPQLSEINNKNIILHQEQGFGDNIQFIRYAKLLKEHGAKTINVIASTPLERLFKSCPHIDKINADTIGDYVIPMMSLPHVLQQNYIPTDIPYFHIPNTQKLTGFNVGIAWTSNKNISCDPIRQEGHRYLPSLSKMVYNNAQKRILKQEWFQKISTLPITLWSLQPDAKIEVDFIKYKEINDFYDTATQIQQMDLIISIDTGIAHLAGALGKPTWTLLPINSEWRWLTNRNDSPWYPTMKLFRQKTDWQDTLDTIYSNLKNNLI
jgi:Tfp pilus assembly protein PilF